MGGGLICGRVVVVVVESDVFDVQKLFQCRLAGASAGFAGKSGDIIANVNFFLKSALKNDF